MNLKLQLSFALKNPSQNMRELSWLNIYCMNEGRQQFEEIMAALIKVFHAISVELRSLSSLIEIIKALFKLKNVYKHEFNSQMNAACTSFTIQ